MLSLTESDLVPIPNAGAQSVDYKAETIKSDDDNCEDIERKKSFVETDEMTLTVQAPRTTDMAETREKMINYKSASSWH